MSEQEPNPGSLFPIRTLCERTEVNSVTLRAWERRYGLLKPQRTGKGHRLYSEADVNRVEQILHWIRRGVPVSRVKSLLEHPSDSVVPETGFNDDDASWQRAVDRLCTAVLDMSVAKTEHCLNEYFLNYPVATCGEKLLQPVLASLQTAAIGRAGCVFLQSEIIRYVIQRFASGKHRAHSAEIQLICGDNTPLWRLAVSALALVDAGLRVQLINQPCSVRVWLDLIQADTRKAHLVFQDGIWREEETNRIKLALHPQLWLCGSAPMTCGLAGQYKRRQPDFYPAPEDAVAAITEQMKNRERL